MIELTDNDEENNEIIGKAYRQNYWSALDFSLKMLVEQSKQYPIKNNEELEKIAKAIEILESLKVSN